jgi:hypothetical protein
VHEKRRFRLRLPRRARGIIASLAIEVKDLFSGHFQDLFSGAVNRESCVTSYGP